MVSGAKKYLKNHLLKSLKDDFIPAFKVYKKRNTGYFSLMRIIFPYITFLGSLYKGVDETKSALEFMVDYMGQIDNEYKDKSGIYYIAYRHGLLHTNMIKVFTYGKKKLGWYVSFANVGQGNRGDYIGTNLAMYPKLFFDDLCKAIELYIADFDFKTKQVKLMDNFKRGFIKMGTFYSIKDIGKDKIVQKFLRKGLKKYGI